MYVEYALNHRVTCYDDCSPNTIQVTEAPQIPSNREDAETESKNSTILDSIHVLVGGHIQTNILLFNILNLYAYVRP